MKPELLQILQHSLGVDEHGLGNQYRNRFVTGPEGGDFQLCRELCRQGFMLDHGPKTMTGGMHFFSVTVEGIVAMRDASPKPPKISLARRRYLDFLSEDGSIPFGKWLKLRAGRKPTEGRT